MNHSQPGLIFYQELVGQIAVTKELQTELIAMLERAIDDPQSFYDEKNDLILSDRGLKYSIYNWVTPKFVLVDKMIDAKQMMEVDWKEAEEDIRFYISEILQAKGYEMKLTPNKKYTGDTYETILSINDKELEPQGYCLEMINIDGDSYVFTIIPLNRKQIVRNMFDQIK